MLHFQITQRSSTLYHDFTSLPAQNFSIIGKMLLKYTSIKDSNVTADFHVQWVPRKNKQKNAEVFRIFLKNSLFNLQYVIIFLSEKGGTSPMVKK